MITITLDELLAWTEEERGKWEAWLPAHPDALSLALKGDRFGTVAGLIGHIFEAENRQSHRFDGGSIPERKDPVGGTVESLFESGRRSRAKFRSATGRMKETDWDRTVKFDTVGGPITVSLRKLALHLPMHEIRHWAQVARTVREHDLAPPGRHDLMFSDVLK